MPLAPARGRKMQRIGRPELLDGSFHHHLLHDRARLEGYVRAVQETVRPGDVVADIGSGSGVLAYFARKAGASRVYAIESNTHSFRALGRNVRRNGVQGEVVPVLADGTEWKPPVPVDVVVCELMETGLLHEPIVGVAQNVHAWPQRPRAFLPKEVALLVEGVEVREDFLGYKASYPGFRATGEDPQLTDAATYARYDFLREAPSDRVEAAFTLTARRDGTLGGIQLRTDTLVAPGVALGASPAYCTPVVLTLDEPFPVRAGDRLRGSIRYDFAYTAEPLEFELAPS